MKILGINSFHADSSCALLIDGIIVSATEEERFTRIKHWAGVPIKSIEYCLNDSNLKIEDIDYIVVGRDFNAKLFKKIKFAIKNYSSSAQMIKHRVLSRKGNVNLKEKITKSFGSCPKIVHAEHHRCHLASAFFSSPYNESTVVSIDGSGDFSTIMIAKGSGSNIEVIESQDFPVSIGILYAAFTQYLGFPYYGDEYKVMGLSPYGKPKYIEELRKIIWSGEKNILEWDSSFFKLDKPVHKYETHQPEVAELFNVEKFESVFGKKRNIGDTLDNRHKDIASSLQRRVEELVFEILIRAHKKTGLKNLCIAGGVAQNSVANGKILQNTPFENLYIPSAGHDAGISMGAAQYYYFNDLQNKRVEPLYDANLGISFTNIQIKQILDDKELKYSFKEDKELFPFVAKAISNSGVIGFFDGKAEFGPRALGSRSILADPRNEKAQQLLNEKIKKRESFRPFAPSILEEYGNEFFENYQFTPFMERVLPIKKEKQKLIPAVTHVDGSGRLQSVSKLLRPRYHQLIFEFFKLTKIPILINTSFNENEPVVNIPEEAIDCYLRTDMDMLVLGNYVLEK
jgi:carbamoyltransferase